MIEELGLDYLLPYILHEKARLLAVKNYLTEAGEVYNQSIAQHKESADSIAALQVEYDFLLFLIKTDQLFTALVLLDHTILNSGKKT